MSDSFHDAYRPINQPKGMGWWCEEDQKEYCKKIYDRGDRDVWLLMKMMRLKLITAEQFRQDIFDYHPNEYSRGQYGSQPNRAE